MLGVCMGNRGVGSKEKLICDAHRGNEELTVNFQIKITRNLEKRVFEKSKRTI